MADIPLGAGRGWQISPWVQGGSGRYPPGCREGVADIPLGAGRGWQISFRVQGGGGRYPPGCREEAADREGVADILPGAGRGWQISPPPLGDVAALYYSLLQS